ncbi:AAA domain-containing protein [Mycena kentingensis (nom. inval.)]|nr:AAA domain-containing protein [Mycena kentingensis (nom. inval.)]
MRSALNHIVRKSVSKSPLLRAPRPLPRPRTRLSSSVAAASDPEPPTDTPTTTVAPVPPDAPAPEDSERVKRKATTRLTTALPKDPPKEPENAVELPEGLEARILWTPDAEPGPSHDSALPPPELFEEALHNLHITLHPQTQHRATFASPLGPLVEPTLALYCPIEGGDYVIDATVREMARRTDAEVLVLDAAQLAAGEWGLFGNAANALQLPRNPLHFRAAPSSSSRQAAPEEEEDDAEGHSPQMGPRQMTFTLFNPPSMGRTLVANPPRRTAPPSKISVFFESVVNTPSSDSKIRPRIIYIRDFPTLAPSSAAWYPALLNSVRSRRKGALHRHSAPVTHPVTIVFGITPPLVPKASSAPRRASSSSPSQPTSEWSEDDASNRAREKRLRERLRRWERGGLEEDLTKVMPLADNAVPDNSHGVIIVGQSSAHALLPPSGDANSDVANELDALFFRSSVLVPRERSLEQERSCRVERRREINELTMRMGVGAVGGVIDKESAAILFETPAQEDKADAEASADEESGSERSQMWEDWADRVELWSTVRAVSDRAVGRAVASRDPTERRTMEPTLVSWEDIDSAWVAHGASRNLRKSWMKESAKVAREQREQDEEDSDDEEAQAASADEVVQQVRNDQSLEPHEKQLLGCIVDTATMPTSFQQVHLPPHTIDSIRTIVSLPLLHPQAFQQGILKEHGMTGCLLFGPPGTGKTLVVRALAKEAGCRMLAVTPADVLDMYVGEGEKLVKAVFSLARRLAPCVIFLDEIDALFGARSSGRDRGGGALAHRSVLTEFMQEMDGLRTSKDDNIIVIGATNRPFDLDEAVLRRLPRRLLVDLPGEAERAEIVNILLRDETLGPDLDSKDIAKKTDGFSGSDLKHLCVSAALDAVKETVVVPWSTNGAGTASDAASSSTEAPSPTDVPRVLHLRHFTKALKEITPSASEFSGTLAELRAWNKEFGEGRTNTKKRQQVWGRDRFGFGEHAKSSGDGRVLPSGGQ